MHAVKNDNQVNYLHTHITHIQNIHSIAGPLVPYNHACPKRGLIHRDRVMQLMNQALYLQATMAGWVQLNLLQIFQSVIGKTVGILLTNKDASGFTSNTLFIPKQDLLMVCIVYRFIRNNERKG